MPKIIKTKLDGVLLVEPDIFKDHRGEFTEIYNEDALAKSGIKIKFVQDDISISRKDVLRGIHSDSQAWKLVSCIAGEVYLVIVNCDPASKQFGLWQSFVVSDKNRYLVLIPPKYGSALLALSEKIIFYYKQSLYYDRYRQSTYKWNDPQFNIRWPIKNPILSKRDTVGHYVDGY